MTDSGDIDNSYPIFEVHRVSSLSRDRAAGIQLNDISRTYTELVPITSFEQFQKASALAIVPPVDHMIVDRNQFKVMVAKNAKDIAAKTTESSVKRMEESIKEVITQSAAEMGSTLTLISTIVQTEQESMNAHMEKLWSQTDGSKSEDLQKRKEALDQALASQQATLQRIFDLVIAKKSNMHHYEFDSLADEAQAEPSSAD